MRRSSRKVVLEKYSSATTPAKPGRVSESKTPVKDVVHSTDTPSKQSGKKRTRTADISTPVTPKSISKLKKNKVSQTSPKKVNENPESEKKAEYNTLETENIEAVLSEDEIEKAEEIMHSLNNGDAITPDMSPKDIEKAEDLEAQSDDSKVQADPNDSDSMSEYDRKDLFEDDEDDYGNNNYENTEPDNYDSSDEKDAHDFGGNDDLDEDVDEGKYDSSKSSENKDQVESENAPANSVPEDLAKNENSENSVKSDDSGENIENSDSGDNSENSDSEDNIRDDDSYEDSESSGSEDSDALDIKGMLLDGKKKKKIPKRSRTVDQETFYEGIQSILNQQVEETSSGTLPVIMSKNKVAEERILADKLASAEKGKQRAEKRKALEKDRVIPTILTIGYEKQLKKIATRGVVQLFNAIKASKAEFSGFDKPTAGGSTKDTENLAGMSKTSFLDLLKTGLE
ncbi:Ribosomal RNA-processing protein 15 [Smittium mucronatum]|uniref:Ribosomal RNA-processing protein 15 n=1 Tax=Smittium mucronatum TaxID=133383 RepID=A0A1R0GN87_9FUNG|nr:Ribosomal RNA-processing protein 15 [Smittium mucronatum]